MAFPFFSNCIQFTPDPAENRWGLPAPAWHCADVPKVYFDERIAQRYETYWPELFEPEAIEPAVDFLADLAGQEGRGSALRRKRAAQRPRTRALYCTGVVCGTCGRCVQLPGTGESVRADRVGGRLVPDHRGTGRYWQGCTCHRSDGSPTAYKYVSDRRYGFSSQCRQ